MSNEKGGELVILDDLRPPKLDALAVRKTAMRDSLVQVMNIRGATTVCNTSELDDFLHYLRSTGYSVLTGMKNRGHVMHPVRTEHPGLRVFSRVPLSKLPKDVDGINLFGITFGDVNPLFEGLGSWFLENDQCRVTRYELIVEGVSNKWTVIPDIGTRGPKAHTWIVGYSGQNLSK